jgi:hypothetical protein
MRDFIDDRQELLRKIPQFAEPDFAQPERLPHKARLPYDPEDEVEDEWKKLSGNSFGHMTSNEWNDCHEVIGRMFTGGDDSDVEDGGSDVENGENVDRYFEMGQDDAMFSKSPRKRKLARGQTTLDIDSVLALFTDLSMIKTKIVLSIVAYGHKNLRASVHISHHCIPLHWIPHFHLGRFGEDIQFDLFMFLPALYNKDHKRRKNNLFNHVKEELRARFMDECLLPAIKSILYSFRESTSIHGLKPATSGTRKIKAMPICGDFPQRRRLMCDSDVD